MQLYLKDGTVETVIGDKAQEFERIIQEHLGDDMLRLYHEIYADLASITELAEHFEEALSDLDWASHELGSVHNQFSNIYDRIFGGAD